MPAKPLAEEVPEGDTVLSKVCYRTKVEKMAEFTPTKSIQCSNLVKDGYAWQ